MPSTYASSTRLELQAAGENSGTWGDITNNNLSVLDSAVFGVKELSPAGSSSTLETTETGEESGTVDDANNKVLVYSGLTVSHTVTVTPNSVKKAYIVHNKSAQQLTFRQGDGSGGTAIVPANTSALVYATGTGVNSTAACVNVTNSLGISDVAITGGTITGLDSPIPIASGGTGGATVAAAQTALSLTPGTNIQAYNERLTDISNAGVNDNYFLSGDGTNIIWESPTDARTSMGVAIGTDVQAYDDGLQSISALTTTVDNMIYTTAADTYATTAITSTGRSLVGAADADAAANVLFTGLTSAELGYLNVSATGTAEASKALVLDSSKDISGIGKIAANQYGENIHDNTTNAAFDLNNGGIFLSSFNTGSQNITFSNLPTTDGVSTSFTIIFTPTVNTNLTFSGVVWANGFKPSSPSANETKIMSFLATRVSGTTKIYGFLAGDNFF